MNPYNYTKYIDNIVIYNKMTEVCKQKAKYNVIFVEKTTAYEIQGTW